jgi:hypothetical protein
MLYVASYTLVSMTTPTRGIEFRAYNYKSKPTCRVTLYQFVCCCKYDAGVLVCEPTCPEQCTVLVELAREDKIDYNTQE